MDELDVLVNESVLFNPYNRKESRARLRRAIYVAAKEELFTCLTKEQRDFLSVPWQYQSGEDDSVTNIAPFIEYLIEDGCRKGMRSVVILKQLLLSEEKLLQWGLPIDEMERIFAEIDARWREEKIAELTFVKGFVTLRIYTC